MKAMPRTRVSLNSKAHQLGWLKTKKILKILKTKKILMIALLKRSTTRFVSFKRQRWMVVYIQQKFVVYWHHLHTHLYRKCAVAS